MKKAWLWILGIALALVVAANIVFHIPYYTITDNRNGKTVYWSLSYEKTLHALAIYNAEDENGMKGHKYYRWHEWSILSHIQCAAGRR